MLENELVSFGKCVFCDELIEQQLIEKHLLNHLKTMTKNATITKNNFKHVIIKLDIFFIHLLVKSTKKLSNIDSFIKKIWVECCGHISDFRQKTKIIPKNSILKDFDETTTKLTYTYDYGDSTILDLILKKSYDLDIDDDLIILTRNEPIDFKCQICNKNTSESICIICDFVFLCNTCSTKHEKECSDYEDYAKSSIVNSPRMGVCGYEGGTIDLQRDGVYKPT
jgi:hypothetical protein